MIRDNELNFLLKANKSIYEQKIRVQQVKTNIHESLNLIKKNKIEQAIQILKEALKK